MTNEFNDIFVLTEADDEENKKEKEKEEDEKDEKETESDKASDDKSDETDDFNDITGDDLDDTEDDSMEGDDLPDDDSDSDDEFNDMMDDDDSDLGDEDSDDDEISPDPSDGDFNTVVVVKTGEGADGSLYEKAAKLGYLLTVASNNMKHVHFNAVGDKFEEIHRESESYYYRFSNLADNFFELACESPLIKLDNPTRAKEHCDCLDVETETEYAFKTAYEVITRNIEAVIQCINDLRSACEGIRPDVQSKCDDILGGFNKDSRFLIRKRLITPAAVSESFNVLL